MEGEEKEHLLERNRERSPPSRTASRRSSWFGSRIYILLVHITLLFSMFANVYLGALLDKDEQLLTIFPELQHLRTVTKSEHATNHTKYSRYSGPPNKQNVAAWEHLLQPLYFNASQDEIRDAGAVPSESVKVKDGGYIASLGVYHELHCLNRLRYSLYFTNSTSGETNVLLDHLDHCLEVLRISAMCRTDLSVYTFSWPEVKNSQFLDAHSLSPRQCRDFEQLEEYAIKRGIGLTPTLLKPATDS